jgi:hypothetical protein
MHLHQFYIHEGKCAWKWSEEVDLLQTYLLHLSVIRVVIDDGRGRKPVI